MILLKRIDCCNAAKIVRGSNTAAFHLTILRAEKISVGTIVDETTD
jgi:hypothetical protein